MCCNRQKYFLSASLCQSIFVSTIQSYSYKPCSFDGFKYTGQFKDGKRHGQGTATLADGTIFIGEFKDNEMNGQGTLWVEGREIRGIWADNKYLYESAESVDK